jgi:acyl carrier protein
VLQLEQVGLDDNFFSLGGNSVLLMVVHSELSKQFGRKIPITELFEFTTVRALAEHLNEGEGPRSDLMVIKEQAIKQRSAFARQRERRIKGVP